MTHGRDFYIKSALGVSGLIVVALSSVHTCTPDAVD
jgi:hypothetical protein